MHKEWFTYHNANNHSTGDWRGNNAPPAFQNPFVLFFLLFFSFIFQVDFFKVSKFSDGPAAKIQMWENLSWYKCWHTLLRCLWLLPHTESDDRQLLQGSAFFTLVCLSGCLPVLLVKVLRVTWNMRGLPLTSQGWKSHWILCFSSDIFINC